MKHKRKVRIYYKVKKHGLQIMYQILERKFGMQKKKKVRKQYINRDG